jgi:hypothetical protein
MLYILLLLFVANTFAEDISPKQTSELKQASEMLTFAKNALIENTNVAKNEFEIKDDDKNTAIKDSEKIQEESPNFDAKYNTAEYRDMFYTTQDSALVNQALDYFLQGKIMKAKPRQFVTKKVQNIKKPLVQLSSIMYNNESFWTVFTNIGKFTYTKPFVDSIRITGISSAEVEFTIPIKGKLRNSIRNMHNELANMERISIQNHNILVTLRTGECIFEEELKITKSCHPIIEEVEKQIEI